MPPAGEPKQQGAGLAKLASNGPLSVRPATAPLPGDSPALCPDRGPPQSDEQLEPTRKRRLPANNGGPHEPPPPVLDMNDASFEQLMSRRRLNPPAVPLTSALSAFPTADGPAHRSHEGLSQHRPTAGVATAGVAAAKRVAGPSTSIVAAAKALADGRTYHILDPNVKPKRRRRKPVPDACYHCGRADTPEWRRGPAGPRTLCNACGLQWAKLRQSKEVAARIEASGPSRPEPHEQQKPHERPKSQERPPQQPQQPQPSQPSQQPQRPQQPQPQQPQPSQRPQRPQQPQPSAQPQQPQ